MGAQLFAGTLSIQARGALKMGARPLTADRMVTVNVRRWNPWIGCLLVASAALAGCAPKTNVSATGNLPAQYPHAYVSIQEIWLNTSATAGPDDTAWVKFPLTTPVTVDL